MRRVPWIQLAITAWSAWQARELLVAWRTSPYDRLGWLALAVWLAPLALLARRPDARSAATWPWFAAIACAFIGLVGELHVLAYVGLAVALAAFRRPDARWAVWLASACAWWPVFGYSLKGLPIAAMPAVRLAVAAAGVAAVLAARRPAAEEAA
jgi:hypothetical protein